MITGLLVVMVLDMHGTFITSMYAPTDYKECVSTVNQGVPEIHTDTKVQNGDRFVTVATCVEFNKGDTFTDNSGHGGI